MEKVLTVREESVGYLREGAAAAAVPAGACCADSGAAVKDACLAAKGACASAVAAMGAASKSVAGCGELVCRVAPPPDLSAEECPLVRGLTPE